jgi:hypothetical protein
MRIFAFVLAIAALILPGSTGCGGGSGGMVFSPTPPVAAEAGGLWYGQFTSDEYGPRQVFAIVSKDGTSQFVISGSRDLHYDGVIRILDSDRLVGDLSCYLESDIPFVGIGGAEPMVLSGDIDPRHGMSGRYSSPSDTGRFNLIYSANYETPSSLDRIAGIYVYNVASSGGGTYTLTIDVGGNGAVFGQDTTSCTYSGMIRVIDHRYNAYDVVLDVTTCGLMDGIYRGLSSLTLDGGDDGPSLMMLSASRSNMALVVGLSR